MNSRRRAAALVEAAVVLPVFLLLILAMIEMSRMGMTFQVLNWAAREGCRTAVISGATRTDVETTVQSILNGGGITSYTETITPTNFAGSPLSAPVTVTLSVPFNQVSWLATPLFLGSATLSASATLSSERPQ